MTGDSSGLIEAGYSRSGLIEAGYSRSGLIEAGYSRHSVKSTHNANR